MTRPSVAVVIPAYNAAPYIGRAIASVRAQKRKVDELVVVDDGSLDGTCDVVAALGEDIRLIRQPNAGPAAARNRGVQEASSELIAFLDADDEWLPDTLALLTDALAALPQVALATADMSAIDQFNRVVYPSWFGKHDLRESVKCWDRGPVPRPVAELLRKNFVGTSVVLVRTQVYRDLRGFRTDLRYGEDLELWARIAARHPIVCLPDVLGLRRVHPDNTTKATEALLIDLARMAEIIRDWGKDVLHDQGLDADTLVARARTDLGYWYFTLGRHADARKALRAAARARATPRTLRYLALSHLPGSAIAGLRRLRSSLHG